MQTLISLYRDHSKEAPCPECAPLYKKWEEVTSARRSTPSELESGVASVRKVCPVANPIPTSPSPGKIKKQITEEMRAFEDELSPCLRIIHADMGRSMGLRAITGDGSLFVMTPGPNRIWLLVVPYRIGGGTSIGEREDAVLEFFCEERFNH